LRNSDCFQSSEEPIDRLVSLLSEERLLAEIDQPIDEAVQAFRLEVRGPFSHSTFNEVLAEFIRHVYQLGLRLPRRLSKPEALTEAVLLLESHYQGGHTEGYDGALLDATAENLDGLELVLSGVGESLKEIERSKYVNWVFIDRIDRLDWGEKRQLVTAYMDQYGDLLPARLRKLDPARLVEDFHALILNHVSSMTLLKQVLRLK
jgi:hypothetical protein